MLGDVLEGGRVRLREFVGSWTPIAAIARTRLGKANSTLGANAVLGAKAFDRAGMFELELGPVTYATYCGFLPGGELTARVAATVALFGRDAPEYRLRIKLREESVPRLQLSTGVKQAGLGRDTWLGSRAGRETWVTINPT